jgi:hypothetical protein
MCTIVGATSKYNYLSACVAELSFWPKNLIELLYSCRLRALLKLKKVEIAQFLTIYCEYYLSTLTLCS